MAQEAEGEKKRHRSPSYPTVGLREAVERVEKLYKKDGRAGAPAKIAAVHIGFGTPHGQALSVLAALKKFGLVVDTNGRVAPSQRALEILNLKDDDPRRAKALREAVMEPPIYRELIEQHRENGWPSDEALASELITYKKFNPNAAMGFVADLRDSVEYAGLSEVAALESGEENEEVPEQQRTDTSLSHQKSPQAPVNFGDLSFYQKPTQRTYSFGLSEDVTATIDITGPAEVEDLEALKDYVDTLIKSWKRKRSKPVEAPA